MQCPTCQRVWPAEFKVCPICAIPLATLADEMAEGASGTIAQAAAADAGGVAVGGDLVGGDKVGGDKITVGDVGPGAVVAAGAESLAVSGSVGGDVLGPGARKETHIHAPAGPEPADLRRAYLEGVLRECGRLRLLGLDTAAGHAGAAESEDVGLESVYVHLDTRRSAAEDEGTTGKSRRLGAESRLLEEKMEHQRLLTALEAAARWPHVALIGGPGSGKSTFASYLALCLAADGLPVEVRPFALERETHLPGWPAGLWLLPVRVMLRDFARQLPVETERGAAAQLWAHIESQMAPLQFGLLLQQALENGQALVILDGLDEVPEQSAGRLTSPRRLVLQAVEDFVGRVFPRARYLVTCRQASYVPPWTLRDFEEAPLDEFDEAKRDRFCVLWYAELARRGQLDAGHVPAKVTSLQRAIRRPDLARMAGNPLLLTVMALVHAREPELPEARALLYEKCVDVVLWLWERRKADEARPSDLLTLLEQGRVDRTFFVRALDRLAYEVHVEGGARPGEADIRTSALIAQLAQLHPAHDLNWARQVVTFIRERAGLLVERRADEVDPVLAFPHRTFQEYLAACWLTEGEDTAAKAAELARQGDHWWEVIKLAAGRLLYVERKVAQPLLLLDFLCPEQVGDDPACWRLGQLAGEVLLELKPEQMVRDATTGGQVAARLERVRGRLVKALGQDKLLAARQRVDVGNVLAQLPGPARRTGAPGSQVQAAGRGTGCAADMGGGAGGDPRFRADAWHLPDEPLLGFVEIPAGPFVMGSDKKQDPQALDAELPQHEVNLPTYYIARYLVTQTQYWVFVQATGRKPLTATIDAERPYEWRDGQPPPHLRNHPVLLVTWHDATAYCQWLTERLRSWKETPELLATLLRVGMGGGPPWTVRLPSEAEWEKAARGVDGRIFPWGNEADPNRASYDDTGIGATSAVGCFPGGASPYGCLDMAGNVWEWCATKWQDNYKDYRDDNDPAGNDARVLRGGAFNYYVGSVRCAYRRYRPDYWGWGYGFRVVLAPCIAPS